MSRTVKQELGRKGEAIAVEFLKRKGHRILARNFHAGRAELDIVSRDGQTLVFSEVKSYFTPPPDAAEFRVHKRKQRNMIAAAYAFLEQNPGVQNDALRFDVLIVDFSSYPAQVTHYEEAFWDEIGWQE